ncbi:hypothetical protein GCM10009000_042030 [Halobacterium noricense]
MKNAARIVGIAFAPTAGANGGELLDAPSAHAIKKLASIATKTTAIVPVVTAFLESVGSVEGEYRLLDER